ncbi:hypothetical protein BD779DRAFT_1519248 [Infundibulicybe gibba]|nr:hypothetical protein BD779DRAFT_1519248 [Infundibulicybe gibba]
MAVGASIDVYAVLSNCLDRIMRKKLPHPAWELFTTNPRFPCSHGASVFINHDTSKPFLVLYVIITKRFQTRNNIVPLDKSARSFSMDGGQFQRHSLHASPMTTQPYQHHGMIVSAGVLLLMSLLQMFQLYPLAIVRQKHYSYIGEDFPAELPLQDDKDVALRFSNNGYAITNDWAWSTLVPGDGRVQLGPDGRLFDVAMYQQLRCLNSIRVAYLANHARPSPMELPNIPEAESCFDTLRQSVLCAADITLDPAKVIFVEGNGTASTVGTEAVHRCRDWVNVRRTVEMNQ